MREPARSAPWLDSVGLAVLLSCVYAMVARGVPHGDGPLYLYNYRVGFESASRHFLVYPVLSVADQLRLLTGSSLFRMAELLCALGSAVGVGWIHAGFRRLGSGRGEAIGAALMVAALPAVVLYATVYELHGIFFAFVGWAFWAAAGYVRQPSRTRAVVLGVIAGLSYFAHATGALTVAVMAAFAAGEVARRSGATRQVIVAQVRPGLLACGAAAFAIVAGVLGLQAFGFRVSTLEALAFASDWAGGAPEAGRRPAGSPVSTVWWEWVLPFAPASLFAWFALRGARVLTLAVAISAIVLVGMAGVILGGRVEFGAYVLPVAAPLVWLVRLAFPARFAVAVVAGSLAVFSGFAPVGSRADVEAAARPLRTRAATGAVFLVGDPFDAQAFLVGAPAAEWFSLQPLTAQSVERVRELESPLIAKLVGRIEAGDRIWITARAQRILEGQLSSEWHPAAGELRAILDRHFVARPAGEDGFAGAELVIR